MLKVLFYFKQKTAYEMRSSDWSSDVCSSDLPRLNIVDRHLRNDGRAHIGEVIIGRRLIRAGGFDRAADATEEVNFPGGVRTQTKAAAVLGIAVEIPSGVCRSSYAGQIVGPRLNQCFARLPETGLRLPAAHIRVPRPPPPGVP